MKNENGKEKQRGKNENTVLKNEELEEIAAGLTDREKNIGDTITPDGSVKAGAVSILESMIDLLIPRLRSDRANRQTAEAVYELYLLIRNQLVALNIDISQAAGISACMIRNLPTLKDMIFRDASAIYEGDPAAHSLYEVMLCYPGFFATAVYRIAHTFLVLGVPLLPRIMSEHAHEKTGIDIHPGATIGESLCIDHGTGIVIGETARIGDRVKIYQGVTLGARSFERDQEGRPIKGGKRHPTVDNDCVIYAGATILGGDTHIGDGSVIGGNVWLTHSVPNGSKIYYENKN